MNSKKSLVKILLVEDEEKIINLLQRSIAELGHSLDVAVDGETGLHLALDRAYALIIMDVGLPGLNGFEVCKRIRAAKILSPILMLTARADEIDKVLGLELGADDYVVKPFSTREVEARITALLRRDRYSQLREESENTKLLRFGPLEIDTEKSKVTIDGTAIELTAIEFRLLHYLASRPGAVVQRARLIEEVWGYHIENYSSTITSHVRRLRSKIEPDPNNPIFLLTAHGVGYRFAEKEDFEKEV